MSVEMQPRLIDADDSILIVIDAQDYFFAKLPAEQRELTANRIAWLVSVASRLDVPIVVTAENLPKLGGPAPLIVERLPSDTPVFNKMVFGLVAEREILAAVKSTGRNVAILVGLETDVCVAQSALGLLAEGFQVVVVADATAAPGVAHQLGLARMSGAGVVISSVKGLYYEWIRTVQRDNQFVLDHGPEIGVPQGITL
jgi:nicotinamidase-related amidase